MATYPTASSGDGGFALESDGPFRWRIERSGEMRVPGVVFASERLLPDILSDRSLEQVVNVAALPGIVDASYAMPDIHLGYGFPIGAMAATDVERSGVVSPGGVGFDISCGVRMLISDLDLDAARPKLDALMNALDTAIPKGVGKGGVWSPRSPAELTSLMADGARFSVRRGFGSERDLDRCEDGGALEGADPDQVSEKARARGMGQVGSLGSGNHFLEVQAVESVVEERTAAAFGLWVGQVCVMIHCGSRGLGHQVCTDHVRKMELAMPRYGIHVVDRQLACAPVDSPEGRSYLGAMAAATNYGRANRQLLSEAARDAFAKALGSRRLDLLYDVSHNLAKLERHVVDGEERLLCVQRKGATLALPPGHEGVPADLRPYGQPVLIPGSMGTGSYVCVGLEGSGAFHSTCHGAGRTMSRNAAVKKIHGEELRRELEGMGVSVRAGSMRGLAEEAPFAYKDVDEVVATCEGAGLAKRVARLRPIGVVKG
jgi:tRNA-splicing ligase RtcB (3'-phosphate/5'-hydroxy nucleic acid ligase)